MRQAVEQDWAAPGLEEVWLPRRSLEALVDGQQPLSSALRTALRRAGYDPDAEAVPRYAQSVFRAVVRVIGASLAPRGTEGEQLRRAGHEFVHGFGRNPVGQVFQAGLREQGPDRALGRLPAAVRIGVDGVRLEMEVLGIRTWRARILKSPPGDSEFICGCLEAMLQLSGAQNPRVEAESSTPLESTVLINWES